jgi:heme/copper-type cytochrome/quinol oxidase subunit 2
MLSRLSNISDAVNGPMLFIAGTSLVMLVGITAVMIYFTIRYHRRHSPVGQDIHGHQMLEVVWTDHPGHSRVWLLLVRLGRLQDHQVAARGCDAHQGHRPHVVVADGVRERRAGG